MTKKELIKALRNLKEDDDIPVMMLNDEWGEWNKLKHVYVGTLYEGVETFDDFVFDDEERSPTQLEDKFPGKRIIWLD